jgi:hypothetical protein
MRWSFVLVVTVTTAIALAPRAWAQPEGLVETVKTGCEQELGTYCSKVTPGA